MLAEEIAADVLRQGLVISAQASTEFQEKLAEIFQFRSKADINIVEEKRNIANTILSSGY